MGGNKFTPGPGSYAMKAEIGNGPKYAIRPKTATVRKDDVPGPGQYNAETVPTKQKSQVSAIGKQARNSEIVNPSVANPGPGAYTTAPLNKGVPSFSYYS